MKPHAEGARQWVHIGSIGFALALRVLSWPEAAAMAASALAFNYFVLPHIGGRALYRPVDHARGFPLGILLYPVSVLLLVLVFRTRLDIAAAAWGILALGDGAATLTGRAAGGRTWPWNREKTVAGSLAFVGWGGAASVALAWWVAPNVTPPPPLAFVVVAPLLAAVTAALVETIPVRLDDNISVPLTAGLVLWVASLATGNAWAAAWPGVRADLPWAIAVNVAFGWIGWRARTVSPSGAIGGSLIGLVAYGAGGPGAWAMLFATFAAASITSRLGLKRKRLLGIDEENEGRRGVGNAVANCGAAVLAAIVAVTSPHAGPAMIAFVAALAAGGSDTVASEIGKAWGRGTFLVTSFGRVKPGTPGAMSLEGTAAGIVAAFALASVGVAAGLIAWSAVVCVVAGATVGAFVESALAATLEGPGIVNNDMLNFINTAVAALVAVTLS